MAENTSRSKVIGGLSFTITDPYTEGHTINANEAQSLNQTRAENIGNNFRSKVDEVVKAAGGVDQVSDEQKAALQAALSEYEASYVFHAGGGGRVTDPVEKEAKKIATELLDAKIKQAGHSITAYKKDNSDKYAANLDKLMALESVQKEAQKIVASRQKMAASVEL